MKRFGDNGEFLADFGNVVIAACPRCAKPVDYTIDLEGKGLVHSFTCLHCGYIRAAYKKDYMKNPMSVFDVDYQLYLVAPCCGELLYARNLQHLSFLENYVAAGLRERTPNINRSVASRLPQWITAARNRDAILRCIKRLRKKYEEEK